MHTELNIMDGACERSGQRALRGPGAGALDCLERGSVEDGSLSPLFPGSPAPRAHFNPGVLAWQPMPFAEDSARYRTISVGRAVGMDPGSEVWVNLPSRERMEPALRAWEEEFGALFQLTSVGLAQAHPRTGQWLRVNDKFCAITGYSAEELTRMRVSEVVPAEDRQRYEERFEAALRGDDSDHSGEGRFLRKDGTFAWVNLTLSVTRGADGEPTRVMASAEDISERKRLEEQLRQAQKLEAVGRLAGGVAHDFNNILVAFTMQLGLLQMEPALDESARQMLRDLDAGAHRAAALTRQLLMFSRRSVVALTPLNLNEVVSNLLKMLVRLIGEDLQLRFDAAEPLPSVEGDPGMMEQVVMNLVVNARDAMPGSGRIDLSTRVVEVGAVAAAADARRRTGRFVCLAVSDTGTGMDEATMRRIFEPFFTTKEPGKGTGLGLATVHGIVAQHKGWVEVESQPGQGATFKVYLPTSTVTPAPVARAKAPVSPARGRGTILVVEDEPDVRRVVVQSLRLLGYQVYEAGNGQEAIDLWRRQENQADLVLTDMVMPRGMTGLELVAELRMLKPDLQAVVSSGYTPERLPVGASNQPPVVYLPKPYAPQTLAGIVRACLDSRPGPTSAASSAGANTAIG